MTRTVLIVEDDPDAREFLKLLVETALRVLVLTATNGQDALDTLGERPVHVILLDVHMPIMDGFTFREHQVQHPQFREIPVICLSAHYDIKYLAARLGIPCFPKPLVDDQGLLETIEAHLT